MLLRAPGPPGLNFTLLFAGLATSVAIVSRAGGPRLSREARIWLAVGVLFGTGLLWRGSEFLRLLAFVAAATAFALPALRAGRAWVRRASVADVCEAVAASGLHAALGSIRLLQKDPWRGDTSPGSRPVPAWRPFAGSGGSALRCGPPRWPWRSGWWTSSSWASWRSSSATFSGAGYAARSHLDRTAEPAPADADVAPPGPDVGYLASPGSDAAPVLVERLDELDETGRCRVARSLLGRWGPGGERDWRSWNRADRRAREAVSAHAPRLRAMAGDEEACEPGPGATANRG